jgi:hypothetical protein
VRLQANTSPTSYHKLVLNVESRLIFTVAFPDKVLSADVKTKRMLDIVPDKLQGSTGTGSKPL